MHALYPLKFQPIFKTALWGGRRLTTLFPTAPANGLLAEAWVLSDQKGPEKFAAKKVTVTGTRDEKAKTIKVDKIEAAK